jgi:hypothetical protein
MSKFIKLNTDQEFVDKVKQIIDPTSFTDLKTVAYSGDYNDITGIPKGYAVETGTLPAGAGTWVKWGYLIEVHVIATSISASGGTIASLPSGLIAQNITLRSYSAIHPTDGSTALLTISSGASGGTLSLTSLWDSTGQHKDFGDVDIRFITMAVTPSAELSK